MTVRSQFLMWLGLMVPAGAASISFTIQLSGVVPAGVGLSPNQSISGLITYNHVLVPTIGSQTLNPLVDPSMTLSFQLAGTEFDEVLDTDPEFPALYFMNGSLAGINYFAWNEHPSATEDGYVIIEPNLTGTVFTYSFDGGSEYSGLVTWPSSTSVTPVPEPRVALLSAMGLLMLLRRRNCH